MHARQDPSGALEHLASLQAGLVTREQANGHGLADRSIQRMVQQGRWQRVAAGLYNTTPARDDFAARAWSAVLSAGDGAMLAELSAGHQQGLVANAPDEVVVLVGQGKRKSPPPGVRLVRRREMPRPVGLLPCTPVAATTVDLCVRCPERMVEWVTTALRGRGTTTQRIRDELAARGRLASGPLTRTRLRQLLDEVDGLESVLEHQFVERVLKPHGLPCGERQFRRGANRHDLRIGPVLIELDGKVGHAGAADTFRDMGRDNGAAVNGYITLRYGHADCWYRPCETAAQLSAVLLNVGEPVAPHRCHHCRHGQ